MKTCTQCFLIKDISEFGIDTQKADGRRPSCKTCKSKSDARYKANNQDAIKERDKKYYALNSDKIKDRAKEWYENHQERAKQNRSAWYEKNWDICKQKRTEWNQKNKEFLKAYMNTYMKLRYKNDIHFKIKHLVSARLRHCIAKNTSTLDYMGCSLDFFKTWIEYQMNETMTWENHGTCWHFDHVVPCNAFDFSNESDVFKCFHWSNIRPLDAIENIRKGDTIQEDVIAKQHKVSCEFTTLYGVPKVDRKIFPAEKKELRYGKNRPNDGILIPKMDNQQPSANGMKSLCVQFRGQMSVGGEKSA